MKFKIKTVQEKFDFVNGWKQARDRESEDG